MFRTGEEFGFHRELQVGEFVAPAITLFHTFDFASVFNCTVFHH